MTAPAERQSYQGLNEPGELSLNESLQKGQAEIKSPLNPRRRQNMETLSLRATLVVAASTARQGSGDSIEKTEEANASV